jgi:RNA polymerase sigma-70 factor, ECF subfamily
MSRAATHSAPPAAGEVPGGAPSAAPTFRAVYAEHAQTVARWAARLGGPAADVEEITQDVFLVVDRRLVEFHGPGRISTWLFGITAKVAANERRRRKLRDWWLRLVPSAGEGDDDTAAHAGAASLDGPLEEVEKRERRVLLHRVLDRLSERHRRALVLFELEEMSVDEVAAHLGLRPGNVRVLLHRARAAFLREMIESQLGAALASHPGARVPRATKERR